MSSKRHNCDSQVYVYITVTWFPMQLDNVLVN